MYHVLVRYSRIGRLLVLNVIVNLSYHMCPVSCNTVISDHVLILGDNKDDITIDNKNSSVNKGTCGLC